jgi:aryl-alcohol dehydrogenase-like predicted oxidoreductase
MERLVLGTAQLGMDYGIANRSGRPDGETVENILGTAWQAGIREIDTAQGYGESEQVIGKALASLGIENSIRIISKFHPKLDHLNRDDLKKSLRNTLKVLKIRHLYAVMLHRESHLDLWDRGLKDIMFEFIDAGFIENIGISVYSPEMAVQALQTSGITFVQIPSNVLDRRFEDSGVFHLAEERQKHLYVRSVFLQGLLTMPVEEMPEEMGWARDVLRNLEAVSQTTGISKRDLSIGYVKCAYPSAKIVIGVETPGQLEENLKSWQSYTPPALVGQIRDTFHGVAERILNPGLWVN